MKEKIKVKPHLKIRVPHKPTKVHKSNKKYSRKKKVKVLREFLFEVDR
ncbi:MAG: hypothetical protein ACPL28_06090 [bacterium]